MTNLIAIPAGLLMALCSVESNLNPHAYTANDGGSPSIGMCQVKLETARRFIPGVTTGDLMRKPVNLMAAALYLQHQFRRYGSWRLAIAAYNTGSLKYNVKGLLINDHYLKKVVTKWKSRALPNPTSR